MCDTQACAECRLARMRIRARERKARQRAKDEVVEQSLPLFDCTERTDWIERMLELEDTRRRRHQRGQWDVTPVQGPLRSTGR